MNRKIAAMLLVLPMGALPIGTLALMSQPATAADITASAAERQAPVVVAQRADDDRRDRDQNNDRREAIRRENDRREAARRQDTRRDARRVWVAGHWERGFLGIGRKWVEGHWETR